MASLYNCLCLDCNHYFISPNEYLKRCEPCDRERHKTEDSDTLEDALVEAEADLMKANERIDLLLEILVSLQKYPAVVDIPLQLGMPPEYPIYTTCNNGQQEKISAC